MRIDEMFQAAQARGSERDLVTVAAFQLGLMSRHIPEESMIDYARACFVLSRGAGVDFETVDSMTRAFQADIQDLGGIG